MNRKPAPIAPVTIAIVGMNTSHLRTQVSAQQGAPERNNACIYLRRINCPNSLIRHR
ncbi:hypothetical protein [Schaalia sp. lx-260]|uniref:hypothetical protein n=1 Tax=Schaalia sp. lx-260 TaxID=2899082 RepID=UPI001E6042A6|nr:hypothetical protein [Schaalia sp. lx-260]MCD4550042.1 hypothetical protein [Schaalia sp. lx-260]